MTDGYLTILQLMYKLQQNTNKYLYNQQHHNSQTINKQASPLFSRIFSAILHAVNEGL